MSSSSYFSAKTRIQPVKSYQINKSFFSITHGVSLHIMYCLIAVLTCLHCLEHQSLPIEFTALLLSSNLNPNLNLHLIAFFRSPFPIAFLYTISLYSPFGLASACKSHLTFVSFCSYLTNLLSLTTALLLLAK